MTAKYSPGPWTIEMGTDDEARTWVSIVSPDCIVADIRGAVHVEGWGFNRNMDDARLIASAPKVLEALKGLARAVATTDVAAALLIEAVAAWASVGEALAIAETAIAEAEGRS